MLAEKVKKFISSNNLISDGESLLVAFSGGADSMCLLHILKTLSYNVSAAHLNHMLRGIEADRDEKAAEQFCKKYDIPFYSERINIADIAKKSGVSEETAGRDERYKFFDRIASEKNIDKIVTAHNKNDNAETVLMHFLRGSGTNGLAGIAARRGNIVRPLLTCTRSEIEDYCKKNALPFVTDSTNLKSVYTRNKVRLELIPYLEKYNKNILSSLTNLSEIMSADKHYFEKKISKLIENKTSVSISTLSTLEDALMLRAIARLAENAGFSCEFKHIKSVITLIKSGATGKQIHCPGGFFEFSGGRISALTTIPEEFCYDIDSTSVIELENYKVFSSPSPLADNFVILPMGGKVQLRSRSAGDKLKVRGMTKKASDIFTNKKIPASLRNKFPVLTLNDEILCIFDIEKSDLLLSSKKYDKFYVLNIVNKEYTNE